MNSAEEPLKQILNQRTIEAQLEVLVKRFSLDLNDYKQRDRLCDTLESVLRQFFPVVNVTKFGSYANNLSIKGSSDLDLYLEFDFEVVNEKTNNEESRQCRSLIKTLPNLRHSGRQRWFLDTVKGMKLQSVINIVGAIIRKFAADFGSVVCVTRASCPVIKFCHRPSKINCDLSLNNGIAAQNTKLLAFCQTLDSRVHPLMFAIRFWAKNNAICTDNQAKISSYALSMLVVVYLQNCTPAILPTVERLQLLSEDSEPNAGWNCSFCQDATKIAKTTNKDSIGLLLKGFFSFYSTMSWTTNVICPRNGAIFPVNDFVRDVRFAKFRVTNINIQDPFLIHRNIAVSVTQSLFNSIVSLVSKAHAILSAEPPCNSSSGHVSGFAAILDLNKGAKTGKRSTAKTTTTAPRKAAIAGVVLQTGDFPVILKESVIKTFKPKIFKKKKLVIENANKNYLLTKLANVIKMIFEKALKFECQDVKQEIACKRKHTDSSEIDSNKRQIIKMEHSETQWTVFPLQGGRVTLTPDEESQQSTTDSSEAESNVFICKVYHKTWNNRRNFRNDLNPECFMQPIMEVEEKLSDLIINVVDGNLKLETPLFQFECSVSELMNEPDKLGLQVHLSCNTTSKEFKSQLVPFLQSYIGKIANQVFLNLPK